MMLTFTQQIFNMDRHETILVICIAIWVGIILIFIYKDYVKRKNRNQ
jgi:hypothetical protein